MDENKKTEAAPEQEAAPVDYSRYMGTLNRIYGRNTTHRRRLGEGITSLKQPPKTGEQPAPEKENGKKDHSFLITLAVCIGIILVLWVIKQF